MAVTFFAVVRDIEAAGLFFFGRAEADEGLDHVGEDRGGDQGDQQGDTDRLELFGEQGLADDVLEVRVQVAVDVARGEDAGHDGPEGAADRVDAEGVERVVMK